MNVPCVNNQGNKITFYEFFEVKEDASLEELKSAYRKICFKHHPDRNNNSKEAEANFKAVQQVWSILCNPSKKKQYDDLLALSKGKIEQKLDVGLYMHFVWNSGSSTVSAGDWYGGSFW